MSDASFEMVELNSYRPQPCSPEVGSDFSGLVIRAPERVVFRRRAPLPSREFAAIPVCGLHAFLQGHDPAGPITLHAKEVGRKEGEPELHLAGPLIEPDESPVKADEHDEPSPAARRAPAPALQVGYFNPNLARYVAIPARAATWDVWVTWGTERSNTVHIQVVDGDFERSAP